MDLNPLNSFGLHKGLGRWRLADLWDSWACFRGPRLALCSGSGASGFAVQEGPRGWRGASPATPRVGWEL